MAPPFYMYLIFSQKIIYKILFINMQGSKCIVAILKIMNTKKMSVNDNVVPLSKIYLYLFSKKIVIQMIIKIGKTCLIIFFFCTFI
jgi:hypothetical protein